MSNLADDDGDVILLVIENEVSGNALANDASKASRLLIRLSDGDVFLPPLVLRPTPPLPGLPEEGETTEITSPGM